MERFRKGHRLTGRSVALMVAGAILGAALLTPAVSTAAAFLTKKKADRRYLGNTTVVSVPSTTSTTGATPVTVRCPSGQQATGGGADSPIFFTGGGSNDAVIVIESRPDPVSGRATGWYVEVSSNSGSDAFAFTAYAVCAP
jgi:hypothetical protein